MHNLGWNHILKENRRENSVNTAKVFGRFQISIWQHYADAKFESVRQRTFNRTLGVRTRWWWRRSVCSINALIASHGHTRWWQKRTIFVFCTPMLYYVYSSVAEQLEFDWSIKESTAFKEANCKQRGEATFCSGTFTTIQEVNNFHFLCNWPCIKIDF